MFQSLLTTLRQRIENRRRYNKIMAEIESLNMRDLIDMGADRTELQRGAWQQVYG